MFTAIDNTRASRGVPITVHLLRLLASAILSAVLAHATSAGDLKIATWNLEHVAERNGEGCRPRDDADYARLRHYVDQLDADVIALQEVQSELAAARVFSLRDYTIYVPDQPFPARGSKCRNNTRERTPQRVGFAVRKGVEFVRNEPLKALDTTPRQGGEPLRWGADVTILANTPLRLLNVHLKAFCARPTDAGENCEKLSAQVPPLRAWIEARDRETVSFMVLGDFNRWLGPDDQLVWLPLNDHRPGAQKLRLVVEEIPTGRPRPQCNQRRFPNFVDHFVLGPSAFARFEPNSFAEIVFSEPPTAAPSDHCPLSIQLR